MSESKIIINNGSIDVIRWNLDLRINQTEPITSEKFPWHYDDTVEFAEDLTVEGFMHALEPFFDIIDSQFIAYTRDYKIREYYNQMFMPLKEPLKDDAYDDNEISHVELYWASEITEYEDLSAGKTDIDFELYASFHGVSKSDGPNYGLSMSPINEWKHYLIKLNHNIHCTKFQNNPGKPSEFITVFKADKLFRLHDVLRYFFFELTWYGYPSDAKEFSDHLVEISENINEADFVEFDIDQMLIDSLETELQTAIEEDNFEGASRIRDRIALIKEKKEK